MMRRAAGALALLALGAAACDNTNGWMYVDRSPLRTLDAPLEVTLVATDGSLDDLAVDPLTGDYLILSMEGINSRPVVMRADRDGGSIVETWAVPEMLLAPDDDVEWYWATDITVGVTRSGKLLLSDGVTKHVLVDPVGSVVTPIPELLAEANHAPYSLATVGNDRDAVEDGQDAPLILAGDEELIVTVEKYPCPDGTIDFWSIRGEELQLVRAVPLSPVVTTMIKTAYVSGPELLIVLSSDALRVIDARSGAVIARLSLLGPGDEGGEFFVSLAGTRIAWDSTKERLAVGSRDESGATVIASYELPLEGL